MRKLEREVGIGNREDVFGGRGEFIYVALGRYALQCGQSIWRVEHLGPMGFIKLA